MAVFNPTYLANLISFVPTYGVHAYTEQYDEPGGSTGVGGLTVPGSGGLVGQISNAGTGAVVGTYNSNVRPLLQVDPGASQAMLQFGWDSSLGYLMEVNSDRTYEWIHRGSQPWTINFKLYYTSTPAGDVFLLGTNDSGTTHAGFSVTLSNSNKVNVRVSDGGQALRSATTNTATVTTNQLYNINISYPGGWNAADTLEFVATPITGGVPGTPVIVSSVPATKTVATTATSWGLMTYGAKPQAFTTIPVAPTSSGAFVGYLADMCIYKAVISSTVRSTDLTKLQAYSPQIVTVPTGPTNTLVRAKNAAVNKTQQPEDIVFLKRYYKFDDPTKMNTTVTTWPTSVSGTVSSNGDHVQLVRNQTDTIIGLSAGELQQDMVWDALCTAGGLATYRTDDGSVGGCVRWALGTPSTSRYDANFNLRNAVGSGVYYEKGTTDQTELWAVKNLDAGDGTGVGQQGSTIISPGSGNDYIQMWGHASTGHNSLIQSNMNNGTFNQQQQQNGNESWQILIRSKNRGIIRMSACLVLTQGAFNPTVLTVSTPDNNLMMGWDGSSADPASNGRLNAHMHVYRYCYFAADIGDKFAFAIARGWLNTLSITSRGPRLSLGVPRSAA